MTLRQKQSAFALAVARLILEADRLGYELTFGEAWRSPHEAARQAQVGGGIANSLHIDRLAIDLNLFIDGELQKDSMKHLPLGVWWESQSTPELTYCWGGRFPRPDGNHYSFAHEGRK